MNASNRLMDLLDDEYRALLNGEYNKLPNIVERKEALEKEPHLLGDTRASEIGRLSDAARRNAEMIEAAKRGFETARGEIRDIRQGLSQATYSRDGARQTLMTSRSRTERKL